MLVLLLLLDVGRLLEQFELNGTPTLWNPSKQPLQWTALLLDTQSHRLLEELNSTTAVNFEPDNMDDKLAVHALVSFVLLAVHMLVRLILLAVHILVKLVLLAVGGVLN